MPSITTGLAFRLPSFISRWAPKPPSAPEPSSSSSSAAPSPPAGPNPLFLTWQWSSSLHLARTATGFEAPVRIPWQDKITYKFIVDGNWTTSDQQPTETDSSGFVNNVYTAPPKPELPTVDVPEPEPEAEATGTGMDEKVEKRLSFVDLIGGTVSSIAGQLHESIVAPAVAFASQMNDPYEAPTPAAEAEPRSFLAEVKDAIAPIVSSAEPVQEEVKETAEENVALVVEKAQETAAEVAPSAPEVESKEPEAEVAEVRTWYSCRWIEMH